MDVCALFRACVKRAGVLAVGNGSRRNRVGYGRIQRQGLCLGVRRSNCILRRSNLNLRAGGKIQRGALRHIGEGYQCAVCGVRGNSGKHTLSKHLRLRAFDENHAKEAADFAGVNLLRVRIFRYILPERVALQIIGCVRRTDADKMRLSVVAFVG
ncbi:hypothetical protein SDC9_114242 [bioreactor metagenome]|uniref:Uncharacterized protein n=1 Tax=bioreactor metagenome TaxID=1076179 RepID=A0A645BPF2_9ZZZZ